MAKNRNNTTTQTTGQPTNRTAAADTEFGTETSTTASTASTANRNRSQNAQNQGTQSTQNQNS